MRVLLVKTSSLGDLIHSFPALTDARSALPGLRVDWLVEEALAEIPLWHPAVERAIPIGLRRWRAGWLKAWRQGEPQALWRALREHRYDLVLDAQGLLKSALPAALAHGPLAGLDRASAREPLASLFYRRRYPVARDSHAVERLRRLFAAALGYGLPETDPDFAIRLPELQVAAQPGILLFHGTTWASKHWPEPYWVELLGLLKANGEQARLAWHSPEERLRAERLMRQADWGVLLPRMGLSELAHCLRGARGVVGLDSGPAHITAALGTPAVTLYGPTSPGLTGALGPLQRNLVADFACAPCLRRVCQYSGPRPVDPPCFERLDPALVWHSLQAQMEARA